MDCSFVGSGRGLLWHGHRLLQVPGLERGPGLGWTVLEDVLHPLELGVLRKERSGVEGPPAGGAPGGEKLIALASSCRPPWRRWCPRAHTGRPSPPRALQDPPLGGRRGPGAELLALQEGVEVIGLEAPGEPTSIFPLCCAMRCCQRTRLARRRAGCPSRSSSSRSAGA